MTEPRADQPLAPHPTLTPYYGSEENKPSYVRRLFDESAVSYDHIESRMAFGTGRWYRRQALERAGLTAGQRVLDVATGTGLVAREAVAITGDPRLVVGLDPSPGMLGEARRQLDISGVLAAGESLPWRDGSYDFLSMGYALRHLADLTVTFREFARVLRPGGTVLVLEWSKPSGRLHLAFLRFYLKWIVPVFTRLTTRNRDAAVLMRYFWETIDACVPPADILTALERAGFADVKRTLVLGMFSEYTGVKR
jgi:demethylmenaquinone methyltransferase/2-methoxy-6-polyprenyl-1,4-benzoquinol methylase